MVPVLRLVSSTHVEPTTGLVLSESGLVLVPADFASAGDEIVVLDGGTDIVANGRTARIERNLPMDGLQVHKQLDDGNVRADLGGDGLGQDGWLGALGEDHVDVLVHHLVDEFRKLC